MKEAETEDFAFVDSELNSIEEKISNEITKKIAENKKIEDKKQEEQNKKRKAEEVRNLKLN